MARALSAWHMASAPARYQIKATWHRRLRMLCPIRRQTPKNDRRRQRRQGIRLYDYKDHRRACAAGTGQISCRMPCHHRRAWRLSRNKLGQRQYPRYEFFRQVVDVVARDGRNYPSSMTSTVGEPGGARGDGRYVPQARLTLPWPGRRCPGRWRMAAIDLPYGADGKKIRVRGNGRRGQL